MCKEKDERKKRIKTMKNLKKKIFFIVVYKAIIFKHSYLEMLAPVFGFIFINIKIKSTRENSIMVIQKASNFIFLVQV